MNDPLISDSELTKESTFKELLSKDKASSEAEQLFLSDVYFSMIETINDNCKKSLLDMGLYHLSRPGKLLRSRIVYNLGTLYKVPKTQMLKWAMACELLHEASLIHDDLQDGDDMRRDQKSIWAKFGNAQAINLGDFLLMLSFKPLETLSSRLTALHCKTALKLVQGQAKEHDMNTKSDVQRILDLKTKAYTESITDEYIECVQGKTGALFSSLATGVSYLANTCEFERHYLDSVFCDLGVIFQIQDDLLDLFGDKKRGLQGADIQEGKFSVLIAIHIDSHKEDQAYIQSVLSKPRKDTTTEDIESIKNLLVEKGTLNRSVSFLTTKINDLKTYLLENQQPDFNGQLFEQILAFVDQILQPINAIYKSPPRSSDL